MLDTLERQKRKLESALKSCSLGVTIGFTHTGVFPRKDEVSVYTKEFIKEFESKTWDFVEPRSMKKSYFEDDVE